MEHLGESAENHTTRIESSGHESCAVPTDLRRLADRDLLKPTLGDAVNSRSRRRRQFEALTLRRNRGADCVKVLVRF